MSPCSMAMRVTAPLSTPWQTGCLPVPMKTLPQAQPHTWVCLRNSRTCLAASACIRWPVVYKRLQMTSQMASKESMAGWAYVPCSASCRVMLENSGHACCSHALTFEDAVANEVAHARANDLSGGTRYPATWLMVARHEKR